MLTNKYNTLMRRVDGAHMLNKCLHVLVVSRSPHVLDEVRVQLRARRPVFTFIHVYFAASRVANSSLCD